MSNSARKSSPSSAAKAEAGGAGDPAERLSHLLETLYAGIADTPPWEAFLRALASETRASFASLILTAPGYKGSATIVTPGADPQFARDYSESLIALDPFVGLPEGEVTSFADFVDPERLSEEFRAYLAGAGSDAVLGVDLRSDAGFEARVRLTRAGSVRPFGAEQRALLTRLVPHLRIALRLFGRLEAEAAEEDIYRGTIEQLALATLILDRHGTVLRRNRIADRLLAERDGIAVDRGRLIVSSRDAARQLEALLERPPPLDRAVRLRIPRPSGATELGAIARAVPTPDYLAASGAVLALFIADPDDAGHISADALRDLFQLTPTEAALAALLASSQALPDAARRLSITHNTARSHLRSIFAKTGARRQAQLVHLLRASVASLASRDPS